MKKLVGFGRLISFITQHIQKEYIAVQSVERKYLLMEDMCTRYNRRIFHMSHHDPILTKCDECLKETNK